MEEKKLIGYSKEAEYSSLRQEILDSITSRDNYIMAMYSITAAGLCVAYELENPILFLIPYIILFAFQNAIATKSENMIVIAAYIAIYLEEGNGWESKNPEIKKLMYNGKPYKRAESIWKFLVGRIGSVQLGILCSLSCIIYSAKDIISASSIYSAVVPSACIFLSIVLYILIRIQTKNVLSLRKRRESYIKNLQNANEREKELTAV